MTAVADVDLEDPASGCAPVLEDTDVLVWCGPEVLGTVTVTAAGSSGGSARTRVAEALADRVLSRTVVRATASESAVTARDVTVVVCTRDRPALLRGCLEQLAHLDPPPARILVVDNASRTPETRVVAEAAGAHVVSEPTPGLDRARNRGWRAADTEVVVYVDDDARTHRGFVAGIARGFWTPRVGAVTGLVVPAELHTPAQRLFERQGGMGKGFVRQVFDLDGWQHGLQSYRLGVGTNMAFRRNVLEATGGFDLRLDAGTPTRGGGDLDMLFRTMLAGFSVVYEPGAVVRHQHRRDWSGLRAQLADSGTSFAALLAKYESEMPDLAPMARRERRRWHLERHVRAPLGALRRRELWRLPLLLSEAQGSRHGRSALAAAGAACPSGPVSDR